MDIEKMNNEIKQIADEYLGELISDSDDEGETYQERGVNIYKNMYDLIFELKKDLDQERSDFQKLSDRNEELRLENLSLKQENTSSAVLFITAQENENLKEENENLKQDIENSEDNVFNLTEERDELQETIKKYKERYGGLSL